MRHILALLALTLATMVRASAPQASLDAYIDREMPASGAPGLAYAVLRDGRIMSSARGERILGSGERVDPDTPFLLGSISKSFTALAVMQLVESDKVELDGAIGRYLPQFAGRPGAAVTVRQLLSHTSGYSTLQGNQSHADPDGGADALARQVARAAEWPLAHPPGSRWEYSNLNYQILGVLIETVSGEDYAGYVTRHILQPLGMAHSFVADGAQHVQMALGHVPWFGTKRALDEAPTQRVTAPQGGVIASARDLARYLAMMMNGRDDIVSAAGKAAMMRPASDASPFYGLGWFIDGERGTVYHTGSSPGVETLAVMVPARREGAVVLVNAGSGIGFGETAQLRHGLAALALGIDYPGEGSRWQQKALFLSLALAPFAFLLSLVWAWFHRAALRAKTGAFGLFSLWFPLLMMAVVTIFLFGVIPHLFGVSIATLSQFQPDLIIAMAATAATGLIWALARLGLAYRRGEKAH